MRTTVTIEQDVEQQLKRYMRDCDVGFKSAINQILRRGLASTVSNDPEPPFKVDASPLNLRPGIDPARLNAAIDDLDIDSFNEVASAQRSDDQDS